MTLCQHYPTRLVCQLLDFPRSYLYRLPAPPPADEAELRQDLVRLAGEWPTYGYRRLTALLRREGRSVNAKRVRRLMNDLGIHGLLPVRGRRTTNSDHNYPRYPNIVKNLEIVQPNQVWVADITYIRLHDDFVFLAVLMDVFTRSIRGWNLGRNLDYALTMTALNRALRHFVPLIHHSDQGVQYAATDYVHRLEALHVQISMAAVGEPRENGYAERLMRTLKEEAIDLTEFRDFADAQAQIGAFIDAVYNRKRIHSSLDYLTPSEFEERWRRQSRH